MSHSKEDVKKVQANKDLAKILEAKRVVYYEKMQAAENTQEFEKYQTLYWAVLVKIKRAKELATSTKYIRKINTSMDEYNIPTNLVSNPSNLR